MNTVNQINQAYVDGIDFVKYFDTPTTHTCLAHNDDKRSTVRDDPTHTVVIRKRWIAQFNKRYRALKGDINRYILHSEITTNQAFDFKSDVGSVVDFMAWLQTRIDKRIFDDIIDPSAMWQNVYINQAYERGVRTATAQLRKQGVNISTAIAGATPAITLGTATVALGTGLSFSSQPIHLDAIQLLYTRDFAALKGVTQTMSGQIARALTDGIEQGLGARQIAKDINDRVDKVGLTRSKLIARTETVRAYNVSVINQSVVVANDTGLEIKLLWKTAGDEKVRNTHAHRNGLLYEPERAFALIGEPNCRCSLIEFVVELDTAKDKKDRAAQRKKGIALAA